MDDGIPLIPKQNMLRALKVRKGSFSTRIENAWKSPNLNHVDIKWGKNFNSKLPLSLSR